MRPPLGTECLHMLAYNLGFDVRERYRRLLAIYRREGLVDVARWVEARLGRIGAK